MFFVNSKPEKFEHGGFTLITHQMLSVHTSLEKFENTTIANHCGFVCEETDWATENNEFIVEIFYREKFLKSASEKLRFRVGLVWTVGLIVEIKLCFRDGLVWTVGLTVEIKLRFQSSNFSGRRCGQSLKHAQTTKLVTLAELTMCLCFETQAEYT